MHKNKIYNAKINDENYSITIGLSKDLIDTIEQNESSDINCNHLITEMLVAVKDTADKVLNKWIKESAIELIPVNQMTSPKEKTFCTVPEQQNGNDVFKIRERIPNNVVNISDLTINTAVNKNTLIRCPNCGQAHIAVANINNKGYILVHNFSTKEFDLVGDPIDFNEDSIDPISLKEGIDVKDYFNDWQQLLKTAKSEGDIIIDNTVSIICPQCKTSSLFTDWKEAYEKPLSFFETEELCDICGGECMEIRGKKTSGNAKSHIYRCEKCGYEKSEEEW